MAIIYLSSTMMWNKSLDEIFNTVYSSGLDGIELWAQHFYSMGYDEEIYLRLASLYPLKGCMHSYSWDLNLASMNRGVRRASVEEVKGSVDLAWRLGMDEVTVHPGHRTLIGADIPYTAMLRESLKEILEYARYRQVDISLEIMEKNGREFATDMGRMQEVCGEMFPAFFYTLDVAHCDSREEIFDCLARNRRISKIHVSNRRGKMLHTPLHDGDYDMKTIMREAARFGLPMVIEGYDPDPECPIAKKNIAFTKSVFRTEELWH